MGAFDSLLDSPLAKHDTVRPIASLTRVSQLSTVDNTRAGGGCCTSSGNSSASLLASALLYLSRSFGELHTQKSPALCVCAKKKEIKR